MLSRVAGDDRQEDGKKAPAYESGKLKAFKKVIDGLIFIYPKRIPIRFEGETGDCQRTLRASTAQGDRVSIASSDSIPVGATMEFEIECLDGRNMKVVREWLDYGKRRGIGQWRNSGKGRFTWEEIT